MTKTDAELAQDFIAATEPFKGQSGKNNPALQAIVKEHGTTLVKRLQANGDTLAEAVHFLRVLLYTNNIK